MRIILTVMVLLFIEIILETGFRINTSLGAGLSVKNVVIYPLFLFAAFRWYNESSIYKDKNVHKLVGFFVLLIAYSTLNLAIPLLISVPGYDFKQGVLLVKGMLVDPLLCFVIFWVFTKRNLTGAGRVLKLLLVIVALFCVLMIIERVVPSIEMYGLDDSAELRLNGPMGEANQTAAVISLCLPMVVSLIFIRGKARVFYAAFTVCFIMSLVITGSRGGILGSSVGCLYLLWKIRRHLALSNKILMVAAVPLLGVIAWFILPPDSRELILHRFSFVSESNVDWEDASAGRTYLWQIGLQLWAKSPIFGQGWGSFQMSTGNSPHNIYLNYLVSLGIAGLAIALIFYWRLFQFYKTTTKLHHDRDATILITGTSASVIALLVSLAFVDLYIPWITVCCILGAAAGYSSALKTLDRIRVIRSEA